MISSPLLRKCLVMIDQSRNVGDLRRAVQEIRDTYGLSHSVFHVTRAPIVKRENPLLLLTYPDEWVDTYTRRDYFSIDPVVKAGRIGFLPIEWSTLDWRSPQNVRFMKEADTYGIGRQGVTLTIRGPRGERSLFTLTSNHTPQHWRALRNSSMNDFQVLGHYLHDRVMVVSGLRREDKMPKLSRREKQCLELVAQGFVPKQIGPKLSLSESAIRLYLSSSRRKMHAVSTAHAIGRAVSLELIRS